MPIIVWDKSFELGIIQIDDQHKRLVSLLNKTYDNFISGAGYEALRSILDDLIDYATYHFITEDALMKSHGYPLLSQHREEHDTFCNWVKEIQKGFNNGNSKLSFEVFQFIQNWLAVHILKSDADYGRFALGLPHNAC